MLGPALSFGLKNRYNKRTNFRSALVAYNAYLVVPIAAWAIAQVMKFALAAFRGKIDFRYLYASGGMPSVHSAVVCALATTALLVDGADSHLFGFAAVLAAIVMYDSLGVRRSAGEQAAAINMLVASLDRNKVKLDQPGLQLREVLGHQPREVAAGAVLGVVLAALFNYDKLGGFGMFIQTVPNHPEIFAYLAVFVLLLVAGWVIKLVLRAMYKKSPTIKKLSAQILVMTQTVGWIGVVTAVLAYERASYLAWRLWPMLMLVVGVVWAIGLWANSRHSVPSALAAEQAQARKLKWLQWGHGKAHKPKRS